MATNVNQTEHYNNTRDTYTQCKPRARAFSRCSLVCMEVAVRTELQKGQLDTPLQNRIQLLSITLFISKP